ncbi:hypothetical protein DPMN_068711 [Dreissena polymorpha]|uniref:Uncharacterized protein n=1 Tax=Dreissena polymorpha TaxID=45954 RepID=A0A9D4BUE5_DREPO|nr:hypothetical protein DPMN_068711 [Dreissena polymorpha]
MPPQRILDIIQINYKFFSRKKYHGPMLGAVKSNLTLIIYTFSCERFSKTTKQSDELK